MKLQGPEYKIIPKWLTNTECDILYNRVIETEEYVKTTGPDEAAALGQYSAYKETDALGGRAGSYNHLDDEVIRGIIMPAIRRIFPDGLNVRMWANTFRKGEGLGIHAHRDANAPNCPPQSWASCILYCGGPTDGTWFNFQAEDSDLAFERKDVRVDNNKGDLIIFGADVPHWVPPHDTDGIRVSIAFDVCEGAGAGPPESLRPIK
tara:strand:+ start:3860 stop:4477 length:618 start_codon:yes stop_codon:yes gene_type:complete